jgi:hypothetical protein
LTTPDAAQAVKDDNSLGIPSVRIFALSDGDSGVDIEGAPSVVFVTYIVFAPNAAADGGAIQTQATVSLASSDTALTLRTKLLHSASKAFTAQGVSLNITDMVMI